MQSFFKKLPRYSLRLLLAYLVYIFTGGVLAYLLPRQARNLPYGVLFRRTVEGGRPRRARTRSAGRHCGRPFRRAE